MLSRTFRLTLLFALFLLVLGVAACASPPPDLYVTNDLTPGGALHFNGTTGASIGSFAAGNAPAGLAFGPDGNLYIAVNTDSDILRYNLSTGTTSVFVSAGTGGMQGPQGLTFGPDGNLYVENGGNSSVLAFSGATGAFLSTFVPSGSGGLNIPDSLAFGGLVFGPDHNLYVASTSNSTILRYNGTTGAFLSTFVPYGSGGLIYPINLTFGPDGNLYVVNAAANSVLSFNGTTGAPIGTFVSNGSGGSGSIFGLAFGPDGSLYVSGNNINTAGASGVLRYNGTTGAFLNTFASVPNGSHLTYLAFGPTATTGPQELITNGGFEAGGLAGWTTNDQSAETGANSGSFIADAGASVPDNAPPTVGPDAGSTYAVSSEVGPGAHTLSQSFTVPGVAQSVTLSFDMFVDNYAGTVTIDPSGLDPTSGGTGNSNQHARVDLLRNGSPIFTTAPDQAGGRNGPGVLRNFYDGADSGPNPHPYTHYSFDITPQAGVPATYTLRFANVTNRAPIHQGVDNVSVKYVPMPTAPSPLSLSVNPATVIAGGSSLLTLTLSAPAQPGPDPSGENRGPYGAVIRLDTSPAIVPYPYGQTSNGGFLFRGNDGNWYVLIPTGQTTTSFSVVTPNVPTPTPVTLTGTYSGASASTTLTINPVQVATLTLNPTAIITGQETTATLTLNAPALPMPDPNSPGRTAPGAVVQISSDSPAAFLPNAIPGPNGTTYEFVPQGQTSITFPVGVGSTTAVTKANFTVALNGSSQTASLTVTPIQVASLTLNPTSVISGQQPTATVTLNSPAIPSQSPLAPGGTVPGVFVKVSSDSAAVSFPSAGYDASGNAYVFVPQGQNSATFTVSTGAVAASTTANITATLNGSSQTAPLTIMAAVFGGVSVYPDPLIGGQGGTGTVSFNGPVAADTTVTLTSNNVAASVPSSVIIPAGQSAVYFPVTTTAVTADATATITAVSGGVTQTASLLVKANTVAGLTLSPATVAGGGVVTGTVTLAGPAAASTTVALSSSNRSVAAPPSSVVLSAGATSATFTFRAGAVTTGTTATLTATLNGTAQSATLTVLPGVKSFSVSPSAVSGGAGATGKVTLAGAAAGDTTVALSSGDASVSLPATVTIAAGTSSASFPITTSPVSSTVKVTLTASFDGTALSTSLTVNAPALSAISVAPSSVTGGAGATGTVTLTAAAVTNVVVTLSSNSPAATLASPSVTVPAGASTATFPITTTPVAGATAVTLTASSGTVTKSTRLTVNVAALISVSISPSSVPGGTGATGTVTLTGVAASAIVVTLTSSSASATLPFATVTVPAGASTTTFPITTAAVAKTTSATVTAISGSVRKTATLTVTH